MDRSKKTELIGHFKAGFIESKAAFFVGVKGMNVQALEKLRRSLDGCGGRLRLAKVTLMRRAADAANVAGIKPLLKDQIGVVFSMDDPICVAKALNDFAKRQKALQVVGGLVESAILDTESVKRLASIPPREVLLARLCGALNSPISGLVRVLAASTCGLVTVLERIKEKKGE